jgi:hypothetical protein
MVAVDLDAMPLLQRTLRLRFLETDSATSAAAAHEGQHNAGCGSTFRRQVPKHWNAKLRSVKDSFERILGIGSRGG